jgi:nucleolar protein 56
MHLLYETASGYALFDVTNFDVLAKNTDDVQQDILDLGKFGKTVNLKSFIPFKSASHALENLNSVSEGILHAYLKDFLELNLPKPSKKTSIRLAVNDKSLASSIKQELGYDCVSDDVVNEIIRGIRFHGEKLLRQLSSGDLTRAQLGLSHSYSRSKVKYNVNRSDNMIIQSIALCDQLDKDINLFSMRIRCA